MSEIQKPLPTWILIVSGIFALMEIGVSLSLFFSPESVADNVDLSAKGVDFLIYMWATRQFALGIIFAVATLKRSVPMLTLAYIFFLVMFVGDMVVGVLLNNTALVMSALVFCLVSAGMIFFINKNRRIGE